MKLYFEGFKNRKNFAREHRMQSQQRPGHALPELCKPKAKAAAGTLFCEPRKLEKIFKNKIPDLENTKNKTNFTEPLKPNTMQKKIMLLILAVICAATLATAQNPCKFFKNEIDPFTGDTIMVTEFVTMHRDENHRVEINFSRINQFSFMFFRLVTSSPICFAFDSTIILLDAQGNKLSLDIYGIDLADCGKLVANRRAFAISAQLTPELAAFIPVAIRFNGINSNITIRQFAGTGAMPPDQIMNMANCIKNSNL